MGNGLAVTPVAEGLEVTVHPPPPPSRTHTKIARHRITPTTKGALVLDETPASAPDGVEASDEMGRFGFDGAEGIAFWVYEDASHETPQARIMFDDMLTLAAFLRHNLPGLFVSDRPTPPADDVREALAKLLWLSSFEFAHPRRTPITRWEDVQTSVDRQKARSQADAILAAFEVRPRGTVTDAEVEAGPVACRKDVPGTVPSWAGEDQISPCKCIRPSGHEGLHACRHENPDDAVKAAPEAQR